MRGTCHLLLMLTLLLILPGFWSCQANGSGQEPVSLSATQQRVTIPVEGMSCMSCVATVKQALSGVDGVDEVSVSLEDKIAMITYDTAKVQVEQLRETISDLGYRAGQTKGVKERN